MQHITVTANESLPPGDGLSILANGQIYPLPYRGDRFNVRLRYYSVNGVCDVDLPLTTSHLPLYFEGDYPVVTNLCGRQSLGQIDLSKVESQVDDSWIINWEHDEDLHDWVVQVGPGNYCYTLTSPLFPDCEVHRCVEVKRSEIAPKQIQHPLQPGSNGSVEFVNHSSPLAQASLTVAGQTYTNLGASLTVSLAAGTYPFQYTYINGCSSQRIRHLGRGLWRRDAGRVLAD